MEKNYLLIGKREGSHVELYNLIGQQLVGYPYNPGLIDLAGLPMPLVVRLDDGSPNLSPIANACYEVPYLSGSI